MKRKIYIAVCLLWVSFLWAQEKAPKAVVPEETYDAGAILSGEPLEHDFVVKNEGTDVLKILSAKPG